MCPYSTKNANSTEPRNGAVHVASERPEAVEHLPTGVAALGDILGGGLARNRLYLIEGNLGTERFPRVW